MKKQLPFILMLSIALGGFFLAQYRTDGFTYDKIVGKVAYDSAWDLKMDATQIAEIQKAFSQPFYYLQKGRQAFVFQSQDKQYVIKLINHDRFRYSDILNALPLPPILDKNRKAKKEKKKERPKNNFDSYKLAFEEYKEQTGLIYVHLNPTDIWKKKLFILTRFGKAYQIDLDTTHYILQKRGKTLFKYLDKVMQKKGEKAFQRGLDEFIALLIQRCNLHIVDDDLNVGENFGFVEDKAIIFDIGRWKKDEALSEYENYRQEAYKISKMLRRWLEKNYSKQLAYFDQKLEDSIDQVFHQ